jgi:hypothetical protein
MVKNDKVFRNNLQPAAAAELLGGVLQCGVMSGEFNYFNYFTEIEEYFWKKRGAHLLVSPLDWAIVETWQKAGVPLDAVLKGIDRAFESYQRSRRGAAGRSMKSLAYCVDAVLDAAAEAKETSAGKGPDDGAPSRASPSFASEEVRAYLLRNRESLSAAAEKTAAVSADLAMRLRDTATRLDDLLPLVDAPGRLDLEDLERRLTVLEEKLSAALAASASEAVMLDIRREMDRALAPYRRKMSAEQLSQLERQYSQKRLFESYSVPRLSLFYLT